MTEPVQPARPRKRTASLPTFHQPQTPPPDPAPHLEPATETRPREILPPPGAAVFGDGDSDVQRDLPIPRLARGALISTSATTDDDEDQVDPKLVAAALAAIIGIAVTVAAVLVKRARRGYTLRRPRKSDVRAVARPLSDILLRHAAITKLSPDLVDGIEIAGAVGRYIEEGPLTVVDVDANLPDDIPTTNPEREQYS